MFNVCFKELREILLVKPVEITKEETNTLCTEDTETFESVDEFYDVRSVSDSEDSDLDADDVFRMSWNCFQVYLHR